MQNICLSISQHLQYLTRRNVRNDYNSVSLVIDASQQLKTTDCSRAPQSHQLCAALLGGIFPQVCVCVCVCVGAVIHHTSSLSLSVYM